MIPEALNHVVSELNAYLQLRSPSTDPDRATLGSLFDRDGKPNAAVADKLIVSVVSVREEPVYRSVEVLRRRSDGVAEFQRPEVSLNIFVFLIANYSDYKEALKALTSVIAFFQRRTSFTLLDPELSEQVQFSFELQPLSFEQQNHLWGSLGAKYMPSIMYKVGIVKVRDAQVEAELPPVRQVASHGSV